MKTENLLSLGLAAILFMSLLLMCGCTGTKKTETSNFLTSVENLGSKAANLAEEVIGAPYLWGGKGYDWNPDTGEWTGGEFVDSGTIKVGYHYYNPGSPNNVAFGKGLDCSGLIFWAYNKAAEATKYKDSSNPVYEENARRQWRDTKRLIQHPIPKDSSEKEEFLGDMKEDLVAGDLLFFFNVENTGYDHVIMYIGNGYIIHSEGSLFKTVKKEKLEDVLDRYEDYFIGYGRVKQETTSTSTTTTLQSTDSKEHEEDKEEILSTSNELKRDKEEAKRAVDAFLKAVKRNEEVDKYVMSKADIDAGIGILEGQTRPDKNVMEKVNESFREAITSANKIKIADSNPPSIHSDVYPYGFCRMLVKACDQEGFCTRFIVYLSLLDDGGWWISYVSDLRLLEKHQIGELHWNENVISPKTQEVVKEFFSLIREEKYAKANHLTDFYYVRGEYAWSSFVNVYDLGEKNKETPFYNIEVLQSHCEEMIPFSLLLGDEEGEYSKIDIDVYRQLDGSFKIGAIR